MFLTKNIYLTWKYTPLNCESASGQLRHGDNPLSKDTTMSEHDIDSGWKRARGAASLPEIHASIPVHAGHSLWRRMLAFAGPGFMVAVGYMDPGNWATDLAGGSKFGYTLLSVILLSNLVAIMMQHLCIKLGVVTERDLAQACRDAYSKPVVWFLWILCELAIAACDLAEVIGAAIALQLMFGIPLVWGCLITVSDVMLILWLQHKGFRWVEALVAVLIFTIGGCFAVQLWLAKPDMGAVAIGFIPSFDILRNPEMLYIATGIIGATVMPHNLYLHSAIVQSRAYPRTQEGKRYAIKLASIDSSVALMGALFINAAILILAAAAFHAHGNHDVGEIQDAYKLLNGVLGVGFAGTLFAVSLLASGQNATLTGTLAGQIVMEGFMNIRLKPWLRRLITRLIAVVPAIIVIGVCGEKKTTDLLVLSQVVLSMQLGFACWPLVRFTSDKTKMGGFANALWLRICAWGATAVLIALNAKVLYDAVFGGDAPSGH